MKNKMFYSEKFKNLFRIIIINNYTKLYYLKNKVFFFCSMINSVSRNTKMIIPLLKG